MRSTFPYRGSFFAAGKVHGAFAVPPLASRSGPVGGDERGDPVVRTSAVSLAQSTVAQGWPQQQSIHSNVYGTGKTPPLPQDSPSPLLHLLPVPLGAAPVPSPETHVSHPCRPPRHRRREQALHLGALSRPPGPHAFQDQPGRCRWSLQPGGAAAGLTTAAREGGREPQVYSAHTSRITSVTPVLCKAKGYFS